MMLTSSQLEAIARQVYRQFPELKGERPTTQRQSRSPKTMARGAAAGVTERYVLTFKGSGQTPDGRTLPRIVRVVADERGRILKMSTSK